MSHPYDASTKYLVENRLADWLPLSGRVATGPVEIVSADLSTVTAAADRALRVHGDPPWLLHTELQSSRDPDLVSNAHLYNALLERQYGAPVQSLIVLLRRSADSPDLTGRLERRFAGEPPYLVFEYRVVRVWQMPPETFPKGGLGLVPLAPLSNVAEADLPALIEQMDERIRHEAAPEEAATLWTATGVIMGLRYARNQVAHLLRGIHGMKDSVTYQAIVEEGIEKGIARGVQALQNLLLHLGLKNLGPADESVERAIRAIKDLDRLNRMGDRLLDVSTWQELLSTP
jgi:hypothetical protein